MDHRRGFAFCFDQRQKIPALVEVGAQARSVGAGQDQPQDLVTVVGCGDQSLEVSCFGGEGLEPGFERQVGVGMVLEQMDRRVGLGPGVVVRSAGDLKGEQAGRLAHEGSAEGILKGPDRGIDGPAAEVVGLGRGLGGGAQKTEQNDKNAVSS